MYVLSEKWLKVVNLSKRWLIHLRGGYSGTYSRPVPTSVGKTLHIE